MADDQQQSDKAILANFVKVAIARDNGESQEVTKIWRFRKSYTLDYTLAFRSGRRYIAGYFPEIKLKSLGVSLKYYDSLLSQEEAEN